MRKYLILMAGFLISYIYAPLLWAQDSVPYYGQHMMWGGGGGWFFGPLFALFWLAIAVAVVVLVVKWLGGIAHQGSMIVPDGNALDILKERFARGEISKEEYSEAKKVLEE